MLNRSQISQGLLPAAIATLMLLPAPALAQEALLRTLTVTGQGKVSIPTTKAQIRLGVELEGQTAATVQEQVAAQSQSVVQYLQAQDVEKLQTTGIRLDARYSYNNQTRRLDGFTGSNQFSFEVPIDRAGSILDGAIAAGATQINGISFLASEAAQEDAKQAALREATAAAQQQAQTVLSALNLTPQEVVTIQIGAAAPPVPFPAPAMLRTAVAESADASSPVLGGEQDVQASVTLQIRY